jgi:homoserine kinase
VVHDGLVELGKVGDGEEHADNVDAQVHGALHLLTHHARQCLYVRVCVCVYVHLRACDYVSVRSKGLHVLMQCTQEHMWKCVCVSTRMCV